MFTQKYLLVSIPNLHGDMPSSKSSLGDMTGRVCWFAGYQCTDTGQTTAASCPVSVRMISLLLFLLYRFCQKLLRCIWWKADEVRD